MKIGIIGAGNIGGTLAKRLSALRHEVQVANSRGPQTLRQLEAESRAKAVRIEEVVRDKDLIVLSIPTHAVTKLPQGLFQDVPDWVAVVDTCNYYPRERDGRIEPIENGMTESRWVSEQIGHATVKAFNTIFPKRLVEGAKPSGTPGRTALAVSGDDTGTKAKVMALIDELGFDAVDSGPLDESWRQQPGMLGHSSDYDVEGLKERLAAAGRERPAQFRGTAESPGTWGDPR